MVYDFDTEIDRMQTSSVKWSMMEMITGLTDLMPLWVADMDFACAPEIVNALKERVDHPIYGYTAPTEGYHEGLIKWQEKRHGWKGVKKEWVTYTPGVVSGFSLAIQAYSQPGDKVIIQPPVYYPFMRQILGNGRQIVNNPLKKENGYYKMDFEDLKEKIDDRTRMIILCSPHNPIGRVWTKEELTKLVEICVEKDIIIISDEIHNDLILGDIKHTPTAIISKEALDRTVTLVAVSKTFNLAGMSTANCIIPNDKLRAKFRAAASKSALHNNLFGIITQDAAYNHGEAWLDELLEYLKGNLEYFENFINLLLNSQNGVHRVHGSLKDHGYFLPSGFAAFINQIRTSEGNCARHYFARRRQVPHYGKPDCAFAAAGLTCKTKRFSFCQREIYSINSLDHVIIC